jgi:protein phosphatase
VPNLFDQLFGLFRKKSAPPRDPDATVPLPALPTTRPPETEHYAPQAAARHLTIGAAQDVGKVRAHNEDTLLVFTGELGGLETMPTFGLFIVADGMGGHSLGERASGLAARSMARAVLERVLPSLLADPRADTERPLLREVMEESMNTANSAVFTSVPESGTTLTCALLIGEQVVLSHVGDSRAYILTGDELEQITRDHSLVQRLQELGQLSAAEAAVHPQRSVLYRAVGQGEGLEVDVESRRLAPGAKLLLCSDGMWGLVPDKQIQQIVHEAVSPQAACEALVAAANAAGGPDNITVLIIQLPS